MRSNDGVNEDVATAELPRKKHCTPSKKAWRGHYCCVPLCKNSSSNQIERERLGLKKLSFHSFPNVETPQAKEWIAKIQCDSGPNFKITKSTRICSVHFKPDDFIFSEFNIQTARHHLRPTAIPSIFPWTSDHHRTSITSQIASSSKQRCELAVSVDKFDVNKFHDNFCSTTETIVSSDVEEIDYVSTEETEDASKIIHELEGKVTYLSERLQQVYRR